ncbi:MAG: FAD-dependent oxidoreductase [Proteobacteria bacterium]|nr:FAD-dependent oxidoreductase [Pseudomonadota bacterium]
MRDRKLDILFKRLEMPNMTLKNRLVMAPMGTTFVPEVLTDYLVRRAEGEVGLITSGLFSVHSSGRAGSPDEPCLEKDEDMKPFLPMVKKVKDAGAKFVAQLSHSGRYCSSKLLGHQAVAPSAVSSRYTGETPRALSTAEVDELVTAFANAAERAWKMGFDGVEFCANSGYLISQFLAPVTNLRTDKYGGDTLQRGTFLFSILEETRKRVGDGCNISVKFDAEDSVEGGKTLEDSLVLAPKIVEAGADRLHIWAGWHEATRPMLPMFVKRGAFSHLAAAIKKVVDVPVATVGRINDPFVAAEILEKGEADLVVMGRQFLCDPDFVKKTREGRVGEIRRCIACCHCFDQMMKTIKDRGKSILQCGQNPELGHEGEALIQPAQRKRKVVVVGGGPAGTEASRVAALRGHDVELFDENDRLGGMVNLAHLPPHKEELKNVTEYYLAQMKALAVKIRLGETFTTAKLKELNPDAVVLATGATEFIPGIAGMDGDNVVPALDALKGAAAIGERVVVVGGGLIGVETAEFLQKQGKEVTIVEMLKSVAADVGPTTRWGLLARIHKTMEILVLTKVVEVKKGSVVVVDQKNERREIPADTVVIAAGLNSRTDLVGALDQSGVEYHMVGSCREPGQIKEAIDDGFAVGCKI